VVKCDGLLTRSWPGDSSFKFREPPHAANEGVEVVYRVADAIYSLEDLFVTMLSVFVLG
jgi:hypothetical protein